MTLRRDARNARAGATATSPRTRAKGRAVDQATAQAPQVRSWLLLTYKVPPEPARRRIALWRKLKALGAVYLQSGVCLLPRTDEHVRHLNVLEKDILDMEGEAVLLETAGLDRVQEEKVIRRFSSERNEAYAELVSRCDDFEAEIAKERGIGKFTYAEVEENEEDLAKLRLWLNKITRLDFYGASLRAEAEHRIERCATLLEDYARQVFEAQHENFGSPARGRSVD